MPLTSKEVASREQAAPEHLIGPDDRGTGEVAGVMVADARQTKRNNPNKKKKKKKNVDLFLLQGSQEDEIETEPETLRPTRRPLSLDQGLPRLRQITRGFSLSPHRAAIEGLASDLARQATLQEADQGQCKDQGQGRVRTEPVNDISTSSRPSQQSTPPPIVPSMEKRPPGVSLLSALLASRQTTARALPDESSPSLVVQPARVSQLLVTGDPFGSGSTPSGISPGLIRPGAPPPANPSVVPLVNKPGSPTTTTGSSSKSSRGRPATMTAGSPTAAKEPPNGSNGLCLW